MELRAMDLAEVRNLVKWLDEQQRKGRQELATVQQQFASQQREVVDLGRRIQELEGALPTLQAQIVRLSQVDQHMDRLKTEIVNLIEQYNDKRVQSEKEMERLRLVEHEATKRVINELQPLIPAVDRLAEQLSHRKAEEERLSQALASVQNQLPAIEARIDERIRDVAYLEEAQRQDARRIAELQQDLVEQQKRTEGVQSKHLALEDSLRRSVAALDRLVQAEQERKKHATEFMEEVNLAEQRRNQQLERWQEQLAEHSELMSGYAKQWRLFEDQNRLSREATAGLLELKAGLEMRQREASELQRVESERMKQQWIEFLAEDDKREKQRSLDSEMRLREQARQRQQADAQYRVLEERLEATTAEIKRLFTLQEKYSDAYRQFSRIWLEGYESVVAPPVTRKVPG
jgi:chromosome segregation ATPase